MWRRARWFGLVAVLLVAAGAFACRQLVGITDNPPEDLTSTFCGLPYGTSECASCVQANCCAESTACAADPACAAFQGCLGPCNGAPSCRAQCFIDYPGFASSFVPALDACQYSKCSTACGLTCGDFGDVLGGLDAGAACNTCVAAKACTSSAACSSSADCLAYAFCYRACPTPDCEQACTRTHEAGAVLLAPAVNAWQGICTTQCAYGSSWFCVGHVSWPVSQSQAVEMTTFVGTGSNEAPVSGAEVSVSEACPPSAEAGDPILAYGQTDDAGTVTFPVPLTTAYSGPRIEHGLEGCLTVTSPAFLPTLAYWGFPLTEPMVTGAPIPLFNPADIEMLDMAAGSVPDPERGIIAIGVFDCAGQPAPEVKVATGLDDRAIRVLYGMPPSAMETATDATGLAYLVNVPVGPLTLTATPNALGQQPSSRVTVNVQANTVTAVTMYPTP